MNEIVGIHGRSILDSRGNPTVEAEVHTSSCIGRAAVPSGKSTGKYEAVELRDGQHAFHGLGVDNAIKNIHKKIFPAIKGMTVTDQKGIDTGNRCLRKSRQWLINEQKRQKHQKSHHVLIKNCLVFGIFF